MATIHQNHSGSGDNIGGNKSISEKSSTLKEPSLPAWALWVGWLVAIAALLFAVYVYVYPH